MKDYQKEVSKVSHSEVVLDKYSKEWEEEQKALEQKIIGEKKGANQKAREVAKKMLQKNMNIEDIIEISGLSKKEIEEIKKELKI